MTRPAFADLYAVRKLPVFQNRLFKPAQKSRACASGELLLAQDLDPGVMRQYDAEYQNEQAVSGVFREHLLLRIPRRPQHSRVHVAVAADHEVRRAV
jgi:hypothetical protein